MPGKIRIGIGGWTFEPWRGVFYPEDLKQKQELAFASRALTSIEINGTYYSTFKLKSWQSWRDETPDGFVFAVKGSRYVTNRKVLADGAAAIDRFLGQGLTELGAKLGPICWQLMPTKRFDAEDIAAFLALLPQERDGVRLRHALEVRHASFACDEFRDIAARARVAVVYAEGGGFPTIEVPAPDFVYARLMLTEEGQPEGLPPSDRRRIVKLAKGWSARGDVFLYLIDGAKVRNPAAAQALIRSLA